MTNYYIINYIPSKKVPGWLVIINTSITGFNNNTTGIVIVDTVAVTKNEPM